MKKEFRKSENTFSALQYTYVIVTRYRRKIYEIPGVKERFLELAKEKAEEMNVVILSANCDGDTAVIKVDAPPEYSPHQIITAIRGHATKALRKEYTPLKSQLTLWTKKYLVVAEGAGVSDEDISAYAMLQPKRPGKRVEKEPTD